MQITSKLENFEIDMIFRTGMSFKTGFDFHTWKQVVKFPLTYVRFLSLYWMLVANNDKFSNIVLRKFLLIIVSSYIDWKQCNRLKATSLSLTLKHKWAFNGLESFTFYHFWFQERTNNGILYKKYGVFRINRPWRYFFLGN